MTTSDSDNRVAPLACLFIFGDLQKRQCLFFAKFLFSLPVPVTLKRFLAELLVFNLGILIPFLIIKLDFQQAVRHADQPDPLSAFALYTFIFDYASVFLSPAGGFHHHRIHGLTRRHAFGQHNVEYRVHPLAFLDGNVRQLGDFALKLGFVVVDNQ